MGSLNCRKWSTIPIINSSLKGFFTPQHLERAALIVWHLNAGGCCCLSKVTCCPGPYNKIGLISSVKLLQQPHHAVPRGFCLLGESQHWYPLAQYSFLFAVEGNVGSSRKSSLPGLEGEHLSVLQHRDRCQAVEQVISRSNQRKLAVPLGAVGGLWGRPCLMMSLWST